MRYPPAAVGSTVIVPKLLGSYELELHSIVAEAVNQRFATIINVGCAEGYYSVGLALKLVEARVHAFDQDPSFRHLCSRMAKLNQVDERISIHGIATAEELRVLVQNDSVLIICDCEGCELDVLDPAIVSGLVSSSILVELHDFVNPTISKIVMSRFQQTHMIKVMESKRRDPRGYDELKTLPEQDAALAVTEFRPEPMRWAWMKPRRRSVGAPQR
jgi:hypothetical protein